MKIRVYQIFIIIIVIISLLIGFKLLKNYINSKQILGNNDNNKPVSIGSDDDYLYLINSDLTSKKIYKFSNYYSSDYILRDNKIYVIYEKSLEEDRTAYVDIINLSTGEKEKITIEEIKVGNNDKDYIVYYKVIKDNRITIVYKNLKENIEYDDNYTNNYQMIQENGSYELTINLNNSEKYYSINKENDDNFKRNTVYYKNSDKNIKKEIYECDERGYIEDISFIRKDLLQISVAHLYSAWSVDQFVYYDINTGKTMERENGYNNIILIDGDIDIKIPELIEDEEETKEFSLDVDKIEQDFSTCKKRIENEVIEDIDEEIICEKVDLSMEDLLEYKNIFIGNKPAAYSFVGDKDKEKYSKISEKNYNIIKYFISISNDKSNDELTKLLDEKHEDKYNKLNAAILCGIIKYYFEEDTNPVYITMYRRIPTGGYEIDLSLRNYYAMSYCFGDYDFNYYSVLVYNDAKSFDDVYNNYEKYEGNNNTFLELSINSYEYMGYWDSLFNGVGW